MTRTLFLAAGLAGLAGLAAQTRAQDILGDAAKLTAKSAELKKAQEDLSSQRQEIAKEAAAVKQDEKKVGDLKASAADGDTGPLEGPFYLHSGAFSNIQYREIGSVGPSRATIDGGGGRGQKFDTLAEAVAAAQKAMQGGTQKSFRIEDANTKTIASGKKGYGGDATNLPSQWRIENPKAPRKDNTALDAAEKALADRRAAAGKAAEKYKAGKAAYDADLAAYNAAVDQLNQALPAALKEIGAPTPTADELKAPKGDFAVEDLTVLATKLKGQAVKDGSSIALLQDVAKLPDPAKWAKGAKVEGATLSPGTPIATFSPDGKFAAGKGSHAAVYVTQNKAGIWVYDQYKTATGEQRPVDARFIRFKNGAGSRSNDAGAYSVIKKGTAVPNLPPEKP